MPRVSFFVEDFGHETFLEALLQRFEKEYHVSVGDIERGSVRGGHGKAISELKQYVRYLQMGRLLKSLRHKFQEWQRSDLPSSTGNPLA